MRLNKNKIIVSALALAIGGSLVGSVGSTIAWYQYSTRANVSFIGESSGFSGNLQMRFANNDEASNVWRTRITWQEMAAELARTHYAEKVVPMTFGQMNRDQALPAKGYVQPKYGKKDMTDWFEAENKHFAQFELQLRYNERDGVKEGEQGQEKDEKNIERKVYLSKLVLQQDASNSSKNKSDLSSAIRVHISSSYKEVDKTDPDNPVLSDLKSKTKLISKNGGATLTEGKLDLNDDGKNDQAYPEDDEFGFSFQRDSNNNLVLDNNNDPVRNELSDIVYGQGAQISYAAKSTYEEADRDNEYLPYGKQAGEEVAAPIYPALAGEANKKLSDLEFDHDLDGDGQAATPKLDKFIGKTVESETEYLSVKVTIWVEGWQELDGSAIWDEVKYVDSSFNVGIQFAVEDAEF